MVPQCDIHAIPESSGTPQRSTDKLASIVHFHGAGIGVVHMEAYMTNLARLVPAPTPRRKFIQQLGAGLAASSLLCSESQAATIAVKASTTDLSSDNERCISYRHQQHMFQTSDGALHLLMNRGTLTPGPALSLFSSFDAGATWQFMQNFAGTGDTSTADGLMVGDDLWMVFHTAVGAVMFVQMHYEAPTRAWAVMALEQAFSSKQYMAQNATLAIDDAGVIWVGITETRAAGGNLRVVTRSAAGAWSDPGLIFGPTDKPAVERSARMVRVPGGMGMVWTVHAATFWARRANDAPANAPWTASLIYPGAAGKAIADPYASHFNVATDPAGGIHLITVEAYDVLYFKYDTVADTWSAPTTIDDSRKVAYAQIGIINGKLAVAFSVQRFAGSVLVSPDFGATWAPYADLNLVPIQTGINYNTARVEFPAIATGPLQILQQYSINTTQRLMMFNVPAP